MSIVSSREIYSQQKADTLANDLDTIAEENIDNCLHDKESEISRTPIITNKHTRKSTSKDMYSTINKKELTTNTPSQDPSAFDYVPMSDTYIFLHLYHEITRAESRMKKRSQK
ncbi:2374_t:CDS:2 [Diversispora eburnea]|uniref:2374_t:CDS:1 n=1 Tax=Diversispora eburnea TaxID=1213867 RepID=A0A9N9A8G3_9GLOM|nr:2374_t:CDS:2 [Diversispora eburnea]